MTFVPADQYDIIAGSGRTRTLPITVVIPARNAARFVGAAIDSASGQTWPPAEIIVVDDGSTDETVLVANQHGARVIAQEHAGPSAARNAGIRAAANPWIGFLDADDIWVSEKLEWQWRGLEACPDVACSFGDYVVFDEEGSEGGSFLGTWRRANPYPLVRRTTLEPCIVRCDHESLVAAHVRGNFIPLSTLVVRRDVLFEVGLFDPTLRFSEDHELEMRVLTKTTAVVVEKITMRYRRHGLNSSSDNAKMLAGEVLVVERVLSHPERYPAQAAVHLRRVRPALLRAAGRSFLAAGNFEEARRLLRESWAVSPNLLTAAWLGAAILFGARSRATGAERA